MVYGVAEGNALHATRLHRDSFSDREMSGHRFFTNLQRRLRVTGSFRVNPTHLGRPDQRIVENENNE